MYPKNPSKFKDLLLLTKKEIMEKKKKNLPVDLEYEILQRIPLGSAVRFCAVTKHWSKLMKTDKFSEGFLSHSLEKPRILFVCSSIVGPPESEPEQSTVHCLRFRTILQEKSHGQLIQKPTFHPVLESDHGYDMSPPVHGLLCCYNGNKSVICNPSGRYFELPDVTQKSEFFLGFDPACKALKVLAMAKYDCSTETKVLTLIPDGNRAWRTLDSMIPHVSSSHGLCLGGKIYYIAHPEDYVTTFLMCFNLLTEEFNIISLPQEIVVENYFLYRSCDVLVAFKDKLAIARDDNRDGALTIWTLEDATTWSKQDFHIPPFREGFEEEFKFIGTARTGEHIYAPQYDEFLPKYESTIDQYVIYHDPITNTVEKVRIEGDFRNFAGRIEPFLDYTENPALSQIGPLPF